VIQESNRRWLQALNDLDTAERNFTIRRFYVAAFYCRKSVIKAMKALFLEKNEGTAAEYPQFARIGGRGIVA
jgi:HEPN domain-containing protein